MNREIKFRAWDNKEKKWLLGYEYGELGGFSMFGECMLFQEWSEIINRFILQQKDRKPEDLILMQYTGLKDKNGKEVYEGDILTPTVYKGGSGKNWTGFKCEVIFSKGMFCFKTNGVLIQSEKPLCNSLYLGEQSNNAFEIIGNIWENKNLLQ